MTTPAPKPKRQLAKTPEIALLESLTSSMERMGKGYMVLHDEQKHASAREAELKVTLDKLQDQLHAMDNRMNHSLDEMNHKFDAMNTAFAPVMRAVDDGKRLGAAMTIAMAIVSIVIGGWWSGLFADIIAVFSKHPNQ